VNNCAVFNIIYGDVYFPIRQRTAIKQTVVRRQTDLAIIINNNESVEIKFGTQFPDSLGY